MCKECEDDGIAIVVGLDDSNLLCFLLPCIDEVIICSMLAAYIDINTMHD